MLIERVVRVRHGGVGGAGQKVVFAHHAQDVGRVAAARAFGVEGADAAPAHGGDGVLHKARFVERVAVDGHLRVGGFGHIQAVADGSGRGAPVFVELEANGACVDLLVQRIGQAGVALAQKAQVHGKGIGRLQHALQVEGAGRAGGGQRAGGGAGATAQHGGDAAGQGFFDLLRADEVDVAVDAAGGDDMALAADDLGTGADDDVHAGLHVGVARFADGRDAPGPQANVGLEDAGVVDDQGIGQHGVHRAATAGACSSPGVGALALRHAVADGLAAAKLHLFAIAACAQRVVGFHFKDEFGIGQAHAVAHGGAEHFGVGASSNGCHGVCSARTDYYVFDSCWRLSIKR